MNVKATLGALLVVTACSIEQGPALNENTTQVEQAHRSNKGECRARYHWTIKDERAPVTPKNDVQYIDTLVPHHSLAIEMANREIQSGADAEVKAMAEKMKADQTREIEELLSIRDELTGCTNVTDIPERHGPTDLAELNQLESIALDKAFLEHMIPHHAGALEASHNALRHLQHAALRDLALKIIDAQSMEIGEMHMKKKEL